MPTETPPVQPSAKDELLAALEKGFQAKASGKLTVEEPAALPATPAPAPASAPAPAQPPPSSEPDPGATARPNPVAPRPGTAELEAKRTATKQQWEEVNTEREKLRTQVKELEAERGQWDQARKAVEEAAQLKTKIAEYDTILRQVAAERHPDLIGPINAKIEAAVKLARSAVAKDQAENVARVLTQPDSDERDGQLDTILDGLSTTKRARLLKAMTDVEEASAQRGALAEHSQQVLMQREQARARQHEQHLSQFDVEMASWVDPANGIELLVEKPGDIEHNQRRNAILENAKALYSGQVSSPRDLARAAIWSAFGETLNLQNIALIKQVTKLNEEITKLKSASPGLGGSGHTDTSGSGPEEKPADMPMSKWITLQAEKAGYQWGRS